MPLSLLRPFRARPDARGGRPARRRGRGTLEAALVVLAGCLGTASPAAADPVLRDAAIEATFQSPTSCEVRAAFTITGGAASVAAEYRLYTGEAGRVEVLEAAGVNADGPSASSGRLHLFHAPYSGSGTDSYTLHYRVTQPQSHAYRCPVWLPTVATDGRSRDVRIRVTLPPNASPGGGAFPTLEWRSDAGTAVLGHVPAFLHVRFSDAAGPAGPWNVARVMDAIALAAIGAGMLAFAWRRKRH